MIGFFAYYWLMIPALILGMYASFKVKRNYNKFSQIRGMRGFSGREVAELILSRNGISNIKVIKGSGVMTDHYDPRNETISLSPHVYDSNSISAIGIAAHECGHAVQHAEGYTPLAIRSMIAPATQFVSKSIGFIIIAGILLSRSGSTLIIDVAIIAYLVIALFHLVTLPVEFNASSRAIRMLDEYGLLYDDDVDGIKKVLSAAALTYVAATLAAIMTIIRLIVIRNRR